MTNYSTQAIRKYTILAATVVLLAACTGASSARFNGPQGVAVDANGNVYVADTGNSLIRKVTASGTVTYFAGTAGVAGSVDGAGSSARFNSPQGIALDSSGKSYVADTGNSTIRLITSAGTTTTLAGTAGMSGSADGTGAVARFSSPQAIAVASDGTAYVADTGNSVIRKVTSAGVVSTFAGSAGASGFADGTGTSALFKSPQGIAVGSDGNIYVADTGNNIIRKVTPAGVVSSLAGTTDNSGSQDGTGTSARFSGPTGIAVVNSGNIYVADTNNSTIRLVTPAGVVTTVAGSAGNRGSTNGVAASARFSNPQGLTASSAGLITIADTGNSLIRQLTTDGTVTTLAGTAGMTGSSNGGSSANDAGGLFGYFSSLNLNKSSATSGSSSSSTSSTSNRSTGM